MDIAELGIRVNSKDAKNAKTDLDGLSGAAGKAEGATNKLAAAAKRMGVALVAAFSVRAVANFFSSTVREANKFDVTMRRVEAVIRATGGAAQRTAEQLRGQAEGLARATLASTEGILEAQQTLLTFRKISGDTFDRTIAAALDMSEALGTDLRSSTLQLAKALEDPITGITALTRSGTVFTEQQKDMVRAMVESGRTAEAQAFILSELEAQYGGTAKAAAEGLAGAQDTLNQAWQEFKLAIADSFGLLEGATRFNRALADAVERLTGWVERLGDRIDNLVTIGGAFLTWLDDVTRLSEGLGVAWDYVAQAVGAALSPFRAVRDSMRGMEEGFANLIRNTGGFGEAIALLGDVAMQTVSGIALLFTDWLPARVKLGMANVRVFFIEALKAMAIEITDFSWTVADALNRIPGFNVEGIGGGVVDALGAAEQNALLAQGTAREGVAASGDPFAGTKESLEALREAIRGTTTEAELLNQTLSGVDGNGDPVDPLGGRTEALRAAVEEEGRILEQARQQRLTDTATLFGSLATIAETGGRKLAKAAATFAAIEATVAAYTAATKAMAETPGGPFARIAAYSTVLAAGLKGVAAIKAAGSSVGASGPSTAATAAAAPQETPQTVLIQGLNRDDLFSGQQIFDLLYQENNNRGRVFQVI